MFNYIFNAIDSILLISIAFTFLLIGGAGVLRRLEEQANWIFAAGIFQLASLLLTMVYYQGHLFTQLQPHIEWPVFALSHWIHFWVPLSIYLYISGFLVEKKPLSRFEVIYLCLSLAFVVFLVVRFAFFNTAFCEGATQRTAIQNGNFECNILLVVASIYVVVPFFATTLAIALACHTKSNWERFRAQNRLFKLATGAVVLYWLWESVIALLILLGSVNIDQTVLASSLIEWMMILLLITWITTRILTPVLKSHKLLLAMNQKEQDDWDKMVEKFEAYMLDEQPQYRKNLTLTRLAHEVGLSRNNTSAIINRHYQQTYTDFINQLRIEKVMQLMQDSNSAGTIQQLYESVGFNSKTSFNVAFKKIAQCPPSEYWARFR